MTGEPGTGSERMPVFAVRTGGGPDPARFGEQIIVGRWSLGLAHLLLKPTQSTGDHENGKNRKEEN